MNWPTCLTPCLTPCVTSCLTSRLTPCLTPCFLHCPAPHPCFTPCLTLCLNLVLRTTTVLHLVLHLVLLPTQARLTPSLACLYTLTSLSHTYLGLLTRSPKLLICDHSTPASVMLTCCVASDIELVIVLYEACHHKFS